MNHFGKAVEKFEYQFWILKTFFNPLKTSPEYTRAGVYGNCVL